MWIAELEDHRLSDFASPMLSYDPAVLEHLPNAGLDWHPSADGDDFDPAEVLVRVGPHLEPADAELYWLLAVMKKKQSDVAALLGTTQPNVCRRFDNVLGRISYLYPLPTLGVSDLVAAMPLDNGDKETIEELVWTLNSAMVGRRRGRPQSSIRYVLLKCLSRLERLSRRDAERWDHVLGLALYVKRFLPELTIRTA